MIHISFSGGRSSAMMLKIMLENYNKDDFVVTFANTGKEKEETLLFVQECSYFFKIPIVWVEAIFENYHLSDLKQRECIGFKVVDFYTASRNGEPFSAMIDNFGVPNRVARFCTNYLKIIPMRLYLDSIGFEEGTYDVAMGIRFDEKNRVLKHKDKLLPLNDFKITSRDVRRFWKNMPFDLQLKSYQGNCDLCMLKSSMKKRTILKHNPEIADWWIKKETQTSTFQENLSVTDLLRLSKQKFKQAKDNDFKPDLFDVNCFCGD